MEQKKVFPEAMMWKEKKENAPEWIKGSIVIHPKKLSLWLEDNKELLSERGWLQVDIKKSKGGNIYLEVNTWKPDTKKAVEDTMTSPSDDFPEGLDTSKQPF